MNIVQQSLINKSLELPGEALLLGRAKRNVLIIVIIGENSLEKSVSDCC